MYEPISIFRRWKDVKLCLTDGKLAIVLNNISRDAIAFILNCAIKIYLWYVNCHRISRKLWPWHDKYSLSLHRNDIRDKHLSCTYTIPQRPHHRIFEQIIHFYDISCQISHLTHEKHLLYSKQSRGTLVYFEWGCTSTLMTLSIPYCLKLFIAVFK